jgi:hypothetical protein
MPCFFAKFLFEFLLLMQAIAMACKRTKTLRKTILALAAEPWIILHLTPTLPCRPSKHALSANASSKKKKKLPPPLPQPKLSQTSRSQFSATKQKFCSNSLDQVV